MPEGTAPRQPTHVVLVGLMGSGKTTVGKKVAKLIGHRFVDADVELEARTGRSVGSWFEDGEPAFRAAEAELLDDLLADPEPLVLGAGGGVVVTEANRRRLQEHDVTAVYLHGTRSSSPRGSRPRRTGRCWPTIRSTCWAPCTSSATRWYREVADAVVEVRPAHEAGEKPKWRIAEQVVEELVALHVVAEDQVSTTVAPS